MSRLALLLALLLPACYVAPTATPPPGGAPPMHSPPPGQCADIDGDGFCADIDCNDQNDSVYPGAVDPANDGIDQNCDGYDY
jgi:hypothetical protein